MQSGGDDPPNNIFDFGQRLRRAIQLLSFAGARDDAYEPSPNHQQLLHKLHLYQRELEKQKEELRHSQQALEESRVRFIDLLDYTSTLYDAAPVGYLTLNSAGNIVEANLTAATLLQSPREALLQQPITQWIAADDHHDFHNFQQQLLTSRHTQRCELQMLHADGTLFFVQMDGAVTTTLLGAADADDTGQESSLRGPYLRITFSDVSARVHLEEEERKTRATLESTLADLQQAQDQLVKQERLAVVGQMAAGIAHDFNNIMASITLYAQLVMRTPDLPGAVQKRMDAIVTQSQRAATLVQQILDFSRRTVMTRQSLALTTFMQQFVEMLGDTLPDTIQVEFVPPTLQVGVDDVVNMDSGRIQQVLLNLAMNARDAMPDGGVVRLALTRLKVDVDSPLVASGLLAPQTWLRIDFSDTGTGIAPENLPHLFEPFFTTKPFGQGSGLGLSQVWGIVKLHEGEIDVVSEVGKGTTFSIYLPVSAEAASPPPPPAKEEVPHGNNELILVVEDSDFLRTAISSALRQLGYQTLTASNGQEGFDLMIKEHAKIALILSDLSMPIMSGKELIRAVRGQGWQQPVIVLSGQPLSEQDITQLESYGRVSRLQKPVVIERLGVALRHALNLQTQ